MDREKLGATALALSIGVVFLAFWIADPSAPDVHPATPDSHRDQEYVGAGACRSCHPSEYASWSRSYHRSMTRKPSELSWSGDQAPSLPVELSLEDQVFALTQKNDEITVRGPDLHQAAAILVARERRASSSTRTLAEALRKSPRVERQLVLVTGSHHYLAFWVEGGATRELRQFPFVYLLKQRRWLKRESAFLKPPDEKAHLARWNANCIQCHSVAGRPLQSEGLRPDGSPFQVYQSDVVDLGIACEACHGPGQDHVKRFRNPWNRHEARSTPPSDGSRAESRRVRGIFVPGQDDQNRGSETCGQCHSYFLPNDPEQWWSSGFSNSYRAGDELGKSRLILNHRMLSNTDLALSAPASSLFWNDGGIMVGGREYNALLESPCNQRGRGRKKLACTSCHSMHGGAPNHQLRPSVVSTDDAPTRSDQMCLSCHQTVEPDHAGHPLTSVGARCVSCHMPRTSYALLQGVTSHLIKTPPRRLTATAAGARAEGSARASTSATATAPHPCALCHVDRSRTWIESEIARLWPPSTPDGLPSTEGQHLSDEEVPWAIQRALSGNAAERALFAYALGQADRTPSSTPWIEAALDLLETDSYAAIVEIARQARPSPTQRPRDALGEKLGTPLQRELKRLFDERDSTPITISE